ncbi:uncharacterized protein DS421_3g80150 [Arachis hypogaea]|nr:uncharacterized protein DS421_3g80150 [Arachis hypogaea]
MKPPRAIASPALPHPLPPTRQSGGWSKQLIDLYLDSKNGSSSKCRKLEDGIFEVDKVYQD